MILKKLRSFRDEWSDNDMRAEIDARIIAPVAEIIAFEDWLLAEIKRSEMHSEYQAANALGHVLGEFRRRCNEDR